MNVLQRLFPQGSTLCFFCGVDSKPLLYLFGFFIGSGLIGSFLVMLWAFLKRKPDEESEDQLAQLPISAEKGGAT